MACPRLVRETLSPLPGVADVKTDFNAKTAICTINPKKFIAKKALKELHDVGYDKAFVVKKKKKKA